MEEKKTRGIVLRQTPYKEADKILTFLGESGEKLSAKAPGCRRKNSKLMAASQPLVYSELLFFRRGEYWQLREAAVQRQFLRLGEDILLFSLASYFAELTEACAQEGLENPPLLSLLLNSLYALDTLKKDPLQVKAVFELRLMALCGYLPSVTGCAVCGAVQPVQPLVHLRHGILHCQACAPPAAGGISMPLTQGALQALRFVLWQEGRRMFSFSLAENGMQKLSDFAEAFLLTQMERGFATLDYYKRLYRQLHGLSAQP